MNRTKKRKRILDFILPFLILVSIGVIIVLSIQLWQALTPRQLNSEAYLYIARGKAEILPWGEEQWEPGFDNSKILQGDSIKTSGNGRSILELYDGSTIRLGPNTNIQIETLEEQNNNYHAQIKLHSGKAWIKTKSQSSGNSKINIKTDHLNVTNEGTIFAIENNTNQVVNLLEGKLNIEVVITSNDVQQIAEKVNIGSGKSITLTPADIAQYENHKSPQIIANISPEFTESEWYQWNASQDRNPTDFKSQGTTQVEIPTTEPATNDQETEDQNEEENQEPETPEETEINAPQITSPNESTLQTEEDTVKIAGTAPTNAEKIIIVENSDDDYILKSFTPGASTWSYTASVKFGNLSSGKNTYRVYAEAADGTRSKAATLTIVYTPSENPATPDNDN